MVDSVIRSAATMLGGTAAELLFTRLPDKLFSPLASTNRRQYWILLCALYQRKFGGDAPLPPSEGFTNREMTRDIEEILFQIDDWENEDGEDTATPLNIRANNVLQRLFESGWLRIDRYGIDRRISMAPSVAHFLSRLISFAETGPLFVAGKIKSIEASVKLVLESGEGDSLQEAADQSRALLEHVRNTGTSVRDLMETLTPDLTTADYAKTFFTSYIEEIFIGDYKELRTKDHPLSRRMNILEQVELLATSTIIRTKVLTWYTTKRGKGDEVLAAKLFERDLDRLRELTRIDEYLARLDMEIRRANRRALAFLDYRIRSLRPLDELIDAAISATLTRTEETTTSFASGFMLIPEGLAEPRRIKERTPSDSLRKTLPSERDIIRIRLMMKAREARSVTAVKLANYINYNADEKLSIPSSDLALKSVEDICAYQSLTALSMSMSSNSKRLRDGTRILARGFKVIQNENNERLGDMITGRGFLIERKILEKDR
ncbi:MULTISPECIES: Wadjet anti-phage system protein JetA family protein [Acinetobacter]|jgi:hypothetical protein|uniref:Wadjet anti-phage system protein JetA family protein n=1 Tax=Acinetobacter TaxID=469 RepID=UPI00124F0D55|nr:MULTISPECIES: Wadjet anti-phage system protein JetA family protein [Acinetobacter]MDH0720240.1 DUF5716 family protein [Acinetobacter junii]MDX8160871.1 DUF5716 family protein [Acinetobacter pittii]MDX8265405.1 DUF5716 family protein [Acinetobacter pittii]MQZ58744.1 hypothetical protein [Acinetobacter junii]